MGDSKTHFDSYNRLYECNETSDFELYARDVYDYIYKLNNFIQPAGT